MTITEAINRGNNMLFTSILGLSGFAFLPESFLEDHDLYKVDDSGLFIIGIIAIIWFFIGKNRYSRSIFPVILTVVAFLVKLFGLIVEFKDKDDAGDDFGGMILFTLATILVIWVFIKSKKLLTKSTE